jgi:hypothetical protein
LDAVKIPAEISYDVPSVPSVITFVQTLKKINGCKIPLRRLSLQGFLNLGTVLFMRYTCQMIW